MTVRSTHGRLQKNTWYSYEKKALYTWNSMPGGTYSGFVNFCKSHAATLQDTDEKHSFFTVSKKTTGGRFGFQVETPNS